jgi:hypothetical protein
MLIRSVILWTLIACVGSACAAPPEPTPAPLAKTAIPPVQPTVVQDSRQITTGGGDPRTAGYWLQWNACAPDSRAETARANGGRAAGWILMDDLLADPGILTGALEVETCQQGVALLQARDLAGTDRSDDPAYTLAAQLTVAQLNLATGAETCAAVEQAIVGAQLLLVSLGFDGTGGYLGPPVGSQDRETALILTDQLAKYNSGALCGP